MNTTMEEAGGEVRYFRYKRDSIDYTQEKENTELKGRSSSGHQSTFFWKDQTSSHNRKKENRGENGTGGTGKVNEQSGKKSINEGLDKTKISETSLVNHSAKMQK